MLNGSSVSSTRISVHSCTRLNSSTQLNSDLLQRSFDENDLDFEFLINAAVLKSLKNAERLGSYLNQPFMRGQKRILSACCICNKGVKIERGQFVLML